MAERLRLSFADDWLELTGFPVERRIEAAGLLSLSVAPEDEEGFWSLQATFGYTGESWWLPDWDLSETAAKRFLNRCADGAARWVVTERNMGGETPWDDHP